MLADDPAFERIMECVFDVRAHETRTYLVLAEVPGSTVSELADDLDRDRSSVNRSLSALMENGLVSRERRLLDDGGYVYQYSVLPLPETKDRMHRAVEEWAETVHGRIDQIDP